MKKNRSVVLARVLVAAKLRNRPQSVPPCAVSPGPAGLVSLLLRSLRAEKAERQGVARVPAHVTCTPPEFFKCLSGYYQMSLQLNTARRDSEAALPLL